MSSREFTHSGHDIHSRAPASGVKRRLLWRLNRLRCMVPAEIPHRAVRTLTAYAQRMGALGTESVPRPDLAPMPRPWVHVPASVDAAPYLEAADRIASGKLDVFALRNIELGFPPRWNRDPKTGREAPMVFGKLLDYRNSDIVGDIKYLWELNRHTHLVTLAQAYVLSGETKYLKVINEHLDSWLDACPYPKGPNWTSALEVALRLINWSVAWQLLGGARSALFAQPEGQRLQQRWLDSVYRHAQFIRGYFSLYSSANNHLIGEAAGLFVAALTWPYWRCAQTWLSTAKSILEREALLQNAPDGVNREQAVSDQLFVLDLLLLTLLAGKANGQWFSVGYESRIERMMEYLASIMDVEGNVPMIGDSDDAAVVRLSQDGGFSPYRSVLATGAILLQRGDFKTKAVALDDKTRWLLGGEADPVFESLCLPEVRSPIRQAFPEGGYFVLGCDFEAENEIRLVVDAGPLGYQSIAAHGHADALAFTLSLGGCEFLVDPGTYAYHTEEAWRHYFRGTSAHNTVRVDGLDQSESGGNFMWLRKARAGCNVWSTTAEHDLFEGWQDGYLRLPDPVMHHRRITLDKAARKVVIEDRLQMAGEHDIELFFHCGELCRVVPLDTGFAVTQGATTLVLIPPQVSAGRSRVYVGNVAPICGWISRRFDDKQAAPTIAWRSRLKGEVILRSEVIC